MTKFKFILDDTSNFPPLVPIQEVSRTYFVSRYFIGRKDFRNFCLNLQQQTNLYLTTSSILPTPPFPKKKKKKNGHQQRPRFNLPAEHILFRAISLVGKIFGTFLACSSLCTANPFRIERPIKREF
jgi:hypothetical protein